MANNWAIVIGINQYRFLQPLRYAKRDAEAMSEFLTQEAKFDRIFLFTDDSPEIGGKPTEPFRANLLRVLRQIFAQPFMKDGDNFWFFFSGHGIRHNEQDYLMPLDGDPEDVENTGIATHTITNYLRSCGADNAVMILDACRSGGKKSGQGIGKQTEEEARQTGVISIFSCSPDQYSYEIEAIKQGAFTYSLLEGLSIRGRCATVERLNQYLQSQVPRLVQQHIGRARQVPYTIAEPIARSHLILMPQYAGLVDIATLKNDAYSAQTDENWGLAERLWIRVLAAASGQDTDAIKAIQSIAIQRNKAVIPAQLESSLPQPILLESATPSTINAPVTTPVNEFTDADRDSQTGINDNVRSSSRAGYTVDPLSRVNQESRISHILLSFFSITSQMKASKVIRIILLSLVNAIIIFVFQPLAYVILYPPSTDMLVNIALNEGTRLALDLRYPECTGFVYVLSVIFTMLWYFSGSQTRATMNKASDILYWTFFWWLLCLLAVSISCFMAVCCFSDSKPFLSLSIVLFVFDILILFWLPTAALSPDAIKDIPPGSFFTRRLLERVFIFARTPL